MDRVSFGETIADTKSAYRVLETSHPPTYYIPPGNVRLDVLRPANRTTICEWKGQAHYFDVVVGDRHAVSAAWSYPEPTHTFAGLRGFLSFYAHRMDACYVGEERVEAQEGDLYGGWITRNIVGPFKGAPGTRGW